MQSLRKEQTPLKTEQRGVVNFCARLGRSPSETQALLQEAYKQDALRKAATRTYYKRFKTLGAALYEDKRKARGSKRRHSAAEESDDDCKNDELNSSGKNSHYLTSNWDPLISQGSILNNGSEKESCEYPNKKIKIHVENNEECSDIDDDLTDILEDSLQEDQISVLECETISEDKNITSSITGDTHNEITRGNGNIDHNTCIKCRNIIKENLLSNQTPNIPTNVPQENVEHINSHPVTKDVLHNEIHATTHNIESPPHIKRENAIRRPGAINWFINLNGECWKIKSYQVCI